MDKKTPLSSPADRTEGGAHPMRNQFVERNGEKFKVLASDGPGAWLISYDSPAAPFFVGDMDAYQRTVPPPAQGGELSAAGQKRLELIQPLLDAGNAAITDKQYRLQVSKDIAERHFTTSRTVLRLYHRYLATGQLLSPKARSPSVNPDYEWAIKTFYFSAKKLSLRGAYEMMLLQRFTDHQGQLAPTRPTFGSFRAYFYSRNYHKSPRKIIARDGLTHYQRNCQPAFGNASTWRKSPGSFQMDATEGVRVNGVLYVPADMDGLYLGDELTLSYDPVNLSRVYLAEHDFRPCMAAPGQGVEELSLAAYKAAQEGRRAMLREAEGNCTSAGIDCLRGIQGVMERASEGVHP